MAYLGARNRNPAHPGALGWRPTQLSRRGSGAVLAALGAENAPESPEGDFDVAAAFEAQRERMERLEKLQEESLKWRRYATYATVAGAIFAFIRLSDILIAVKRRKKSED